MMSIPRRQSAAASTSKLGLRATARALDALMLGVVGLSIGAVIGFGPVWFALQFGLVAVYFVGSDVWTGATIGKALLGLRVVGDDNGRTPTATQAVRREAFVAAGAVPFLGPVLALVAWSAVAWSIRGSADGTGIHDRVAMTRVVGARENLRPGGAT